MLLAGLLDAGLPLAQLYAEFEKLPVTGYELELQKTHRGPIHGTHLNVKLTGQAQGPFTFQDFLKWVDESSLNTSMKVAGSKVLERMAKAEARVHSQSVEHVQLRELGSLDTLIDVMGFVIGLELMEIERVYSSSLPAGGGWIHSQHGMLPAPSPATLELISMGEGSLIPLPVGMDPPGELVTPTGAALITVLAEFNAPPMLVQQIGYGIGTRDIPTLPNAVGLWVGSIAGEPSVGQMVLLETNLDDASPELLGYTMERLLELGARDVWFTSIQMKKNRPGIQLSVLAPPNLEHDVTELLLRETPTLGVRFRAAYRYEAERELISVPSSLGPIKVKVKRLGNLVIGISPEYEDCRQIAIDNDLSLQEVYHRVTQEAGNFLGL
jgi:uncharacterized protein (TIGR00299 family) protein